MFEVVGLEVCEVRWKAVKGDVGFVVEDVVAAVELRVTFWVLVERLFAVLVLMGETDREEGRDLLLGFVVLEVLENEKDG